MSADQSGDEVDGLAWQQQRGTVKQQRKPGVRSVLVDSSPTKGFLVSDGGAPHPVPLPTNNIQPG